VVVVPMCLARHMAAARVEVAPMELAADAPQPVRSRHLKRGQLPGPGQLGRRAASARDHGHGYPARRSGAGERQWHHILTRIADPLSADWDRIIDGETPRSAATAGNAS